LLKVLKNTLLPASNKDFTLSQLIHRTAGSFKRLLKFCRAAQIVPVVQTALQRAEDGR
jgi:hypothetical protein